MTDEERIARLEKEIQNFNDIVSGVPELQGGFPELKKLPNLEDRIKQIKAAHEKFELTGAGGLATVEGNLRTGCAVNFKCPDTG